MRHRGNWFVETVNPHVSSTIVQSFGAELRSVWPDIQKTYIRVYIFDWAQFLGMCSLVSDSRWGLCCITTKFNMCILCVQNPCLGNPLARQFCKAKVLINEPKCGTFLKLHISWRTLILHVIFLRCEAAYSESPWFE